MLAEALARSASASMGGGRANAEQPAGVAQVTRGTTVYRVE
jgi:hypothetical protein